MTLPKLLSKLGTLSKLSLVTSKTKPVTAGRNLIICDRKYCSILSRRLTKDNHMEDIVQNCNLWNSR